MKFNRGAKRSWAGTVGRSQIAAIAVKNATQQAQWIQLPILAGASAMSPVGHEETLHSRYPVLAFHEVRARLVCVDLQIFRGRFKEEIPTV